jgi:peptidylprolyl isomerase
VLQKYWPLLVLIAVGIVALVLLNRGGGGDRPTELQVEDQKVGEGPEAKPGDKARVHYTGRLLKTGVKFDSSKDRGTPFDFVIGQSAVIQGWHDGVPGMKVGGTRKLIIPARLAYGRDGRKPVIPPDADLEFEITLVEIVKQEPPKPGLAELKKEDVQVGEGPEAKTGDRVRVHYHGRFLSNRVEFDSSHKRAEPFTFTLGRREVIQGWDEGVVGMKVGGKRKLQIPSRLAYGADGRPPSIPPNSDLEFDVELLAIVQ